MCRNGCSKHNKGKYPQRMKGWERFFRAWRRGWKPGYFQWSNNLSFVRNILAFSVKTKETWLIQDQPRLPIKLCYFHFPMRLWALDSLKFANAHSNFRESKSNKRIIWTDRNGNIVWNYKHMSGPRRNLELHLTDTSPQSSPLGKTWFLTIPNGIAT